MSSLRKKPVMVARHHCAATSFQRLFRGWVCRKSTCVDALMSVLRGCDAARRELNALLPQDMPASIAFRHAMYSMCMRQSKIRDYRLNLTFVLSLRRCHYFMMDTLYTRNSAVHVFVPTLEMPSRVCRPRHGASVRHLPSVLDTAWMRYCTIMDLNRLRRTCRRWSKELTDKDYESTLCVDHLGYKSGSCRRAMQNIQLFRHGFNAPWSFLRISSPLTGSPHRTGKIIGVMPAGGNRIQFLTSRGYMSLVQPRVAHQASYCIFDANQNTRAEVRQLSYAGDGGSYAVLLTPQGWMSEKIVVFNCETEAYSKVSFGTYGMTCVTSIEMYSSTVLYYMCADDYVYIARRDTDSRWSVRRLMHGDDPVRGTRLVRTAIGCAFVSSTQSLTVYYHDASSSPTHVDVRSCRLPGPGRIVAISDRMGGKTRIVVAVRNEMRCVYTTSWVQSTLKDWSRVPLPAVVVQGMRSIQFAGHLLLYANDQGVLSSISTLQAHSAAKLVACPPGWEYARFYSMCDMIFATTPRGRGLYRLMNTCGAVCSTVVYSG